MKRTDSQPDIDEAAAWRTREAFAVASILIVLAGVTHSPSLLRPTEFVMSPADVLLRQPELGGSAEYVPHNRLLIDPVLQFEPWEGWIGHEAAAGRFAWWNPFSGTGVPLAANGQSRMFDPLAWAFRLLPGGTNAARESAVRFVVCGLGTWRLAFALGCGPLWRAWAGLTVPLTGFFTLWRLYPLASVGTVLPWFWLACANLLAAPSVRAVSWMSLAVAWLMAAGNVQVAAVGFCGAIPLFLLRSEHGESTIVKRISKSLPTLAAIVCGLVLASPAWVGLLDYLDRSPVWADRLAEHSGAGRGASARWADLPCLVFPFLYGSERRGDANVAKAVGASNANEAAAGSCGLVAALVLIPASIRLRGCRASKWALILTIAGLWIGYRLPPVGLIWHRLPVFQGIDPRRFVVLATFGGVLLAGSGLQRIASGQLFSGFERQGPRFWLAVACSCFLLAAVPLAAQAKLEAQAQRHYETAVPPGPEHDRIVAVRVADQMRGLTRRWPAYIAGRGVWLILIAGIWKVSRFDPKKRAAALGLAGMVELVAFGWGYNPQIRAGELAGKLDTRVIGVLKELAAEARAKGHEARFLAVGECLPPNQLMRFGLKDLRNYDSIELLATLEGLDGLFENEGNEDRSSRRSITWSGVRRTAAALRDRGVIGVVGLTRPGDGLFDEIREPIRGVFVGVWASVPKADGPAHAVEEQGGSIRIRMERTYGAKTQPNAEQVLRIRESFDSGWRVEGQAAGLVRLEAEPGTGMIRCVTAPEFQEGEFTLTYGPIWYDRTIVPAVLAAVVIVAGLTVPSRASAKKVGNVLFRPTDGGVESKNLR